MRWQLLAAGAAAYALALIAMAPATLIDAGLRSASAGQLRLAEARGTLWSGTGQLEIADAQGRSGLSKRLAWRVRPAEVFLARLRYEVDFDLAAQAFPVRVSWSRMELGNVNIKVPARALGLVIPRLAPLDLMGDVQVHIMNLFLERSNTQGSATLIWNAAGSALSPVSPLGDYELRIDGDGARNHAILRTLNGPLQLDGQGSWASGREAAFLATASVPAEFQQRLAPFLQLIAVEQDNESFTLKFP